MANDIVRFANSVELVTGKKRGRKPVFSASLFYPYKEERALQGETRNEFMRFIEEAYAKATQGLVFSDDIKELYDYESEFPEDFRKQVESSARAIARKSMDNFAVQSEMIIGKPYYPSEVKSDILTSWESNFFMQCKSAEDDAKKDLARIIQQGKDEGWNKKQLEKAVKEQLPDKYKNRAELIARTETAKLNSRVNRETYREIGIQYYTWMTTLDGRERSSHANMNNLICSVDNPNVYYEETENGLVEHERGGDMVHLHPGEDFQCRCSMVMWDPMLQGKYAVKEEPEQEPEEKPKTTAEILKETQEQLEMARKQLEGSNRKNEILQMAQARHAARTQTERKNILNRLNNRLAIRKLANEVMKEADGINGVGVEELRELVKGGSQKQYVAMNRKAKSVRSKIEELRNMKYVQNPIKVAKDFDYQTAVSVENSIKTKVEKWDKYNVSLAERKDKLEYEIKWVEDHKKYSSWKVAQDAYKKLLEEVNKDIQVESISAKLPELKKYASSHKRFTNFKKWISELEGMVANKSVYTEAELLKQLNKVEKEQARIKKFDPKTAVTSNQNNVTSVKYGVDNGIQKMEMPTGMPYDQKIESIKELTLVDDATAKDFESAVKGFTYQWDYEIRHYQMGDKSLVPHHGHTIAEIDKKAHDLEEFISKSPKWGGGATYRGMSLSQNNLAKYKDDMAKGNLIEMKGSASWSTDESIGEKFARMNLGQNDPAGDQMSEKVLFVNNKEQPLGTSIRHLSNYSNESEILCSKNARYKITGYQYDKQTRYHYFFVDPS